MASVRRHMAMYFLKMWHIVCLVLFIFFGICTLTGGIITHFMFPSLFRDGIIKNKVISPESQSYDQWVKPTIPIYLEFYFFNCTNVQDFVRHEIKPEFQEVGPYVFREHREKVDIEDIDEDRVLYYQKKSYTFDAEKTNGSLDDIIHTIDVPVFSSGHGVRFQTPGIQLVIDTAIKHNGSDLTVKIPVRQFLFDGYKNFMLDLANSMSKFSKKQVPEKFGWFYKKNNSLDGPYVVNNGKKDINNVGFIDKYHNTSEMPFYGRYCNFINGTAADVFPPFMDDVTEMQFFAGDLCRSLTFNYQEMVTLDGIKARRFVPKKNLLDDGFADEANKCFCTGECIKPGLLNISSCRDGAPAFISFPHFLHADESYLKNVKGLNPDPEKHEFIMDIEPTLGVPVNVAGRFQVNILVQSYGTETTMSSFKTFHRKTYFPMLWFSQVASLDKKTTDQLLTVTQKIHTYVSIAKISLIILGLLMINIPICICIYCYMRFNPKTVSKGKDYELAPTKESVDQHAPETEKM